MKKWLPIFLVCLITFISLTPKVGIFAYTENDYYQAVASYYLANMLVSGDATELDFSDGQGDPTFLEALGKALVTNDYTGLAEWGLNTLEDTVSYIKESVQTGIYNIAPSIYDYLYFDSNIKIDKHQGHIMKNLFTELQNSSDSPTPSPSPSVPVEYQSYIDRINKKDQTDNRYFWFYNCIPEYNDGGYIYTLNQYPIYNYTWTALNYSEFDSAFNQGTSWSTPYIAPLDIIDINIIHTSDNGDTPLYSWSRSDVTKSSVVTSQSQLWINFAYTSISYNWNTNTYSFSANGVQEGSTTVNHSNNNVSLANCLNNIARYYKNVNIYVDGVAWSIVGNDNTSTIQLGDLLTILDDNLASYYYPKPVYFDMSDIIDKIINAIENKEVITYDDIDDFIYDVNGNQVVGVVNFYRTDYDVLASEQIPFYPAFYYDDTLNEYVQGGATIINISTEALPPDILNVLVACGVILIFGYVIRRLLE